MLEKRQAYLNSIDNFGTRPSLALKIVSHTNYYFAGDTVLRAVIQLCSNGRADAMEEREKVGTRRPQGRCWGPALGQGEAGKVKEGCLLLVGLWERGLKKVLGEALGEITGQCLSRGHRLGWMTGRGG